MATGEVFSTFVPDDDIVSDRQKVSVGLFSGDAGTLSTVFTSSVQTSSAGQYYLDVYNVATSSTTTTPEVQFSIAYGHYAGSGSLILNQQYPTKAIWTQYKNWVLLPTDNAFTFSGVNKQHVIVMNMQRARVRQKIDTAGWQLTLKGPGGVSTTWIDDSSISSQTIGISGRMYNIVSGTIATGVSGSPSTSIGMVYPDAGLMVFNPDAVFTSAGSIVCNTSSSNTNASNHVNFFNAISSSMSSGNGFIARNAEDISSTHYFVRVKNKQFNYSNNPTFVTGSNGAFYNQNMYKNPTVYITTVGLYNDNNELLAVAKLSQPVKKTFNRESTLRVKLDF